MVRYVILSGFFTSPCDHARTSSAVASPIRSSSNALTSSTYSYFLRPVVVWRFTDELRRRARPSGAEGRAWPLQLVDAARVGTARQVNTEFFLRPVDRLVVVTEFNLGSISRENFHVEAQGLHLLHEHLERFRNARFRDVLALDDRLVHLHAASDVVRLDREEFLQRVRGTVGLQGPHFHLTEALATELGLAPEGLLGDHRVRAGGARVDLVVHEVVQLQDVHVSHRDRFGVGLTGAAVIQPRLAVGADDPVAVPVRDGHPEQTAEFLFLHTVENGGRHRGARFALESLRRERFRPRGDLAVLRVLDAGVPSLLGDPPEVGFHHLPDVHPAGNAEGVEDDVDGGAVFHEGHVLDREDLRDDTLVPVAAGELIAVGDLAPLGDVDTHEVVDSGGQFVAVFKVELADGDDGPGFTVGYLQRGVTHLSGLLTEDRAQAPLCGREFGFPLRGHLPHEDVAGGDFRTDAHDAPLVEVPEDLVGDVGDVAGDLFRPELGVPGVDLVLLDVDRGEDVVLDQALGEDDRVLVVVPFPRHEGGDDVLPEREFALFGRRAVGEHGAHLHPVAFTGEHALVVGGALVGTLELGDLVGEGGAVVAGNHDGVGRYFGDDAGLGRDHDVTGVDGCAAFHPGSHVRGFGTDERHSLTLHVRTHERAVGVVVFEERNHRRRHRDHLARGDVHVVDLVGGNVGGFPAAGAHEHRVVREVPVLTDDRVRLGDDVAVLVVGGQVLDVVGHLALVDLAVGGLHETERVDPRVGGERTDEPDVRAFRGFDRAHAPVVGGVHVPHFHPGAVPREATGAQRRQAALVGESGERVVLVHELRQLRGTEELPDRGDHGADVDEGLRGDRFDVLGGHALAHDPLHPGEPGAHLVLDEFTHGADAAVAEVVDVVGLDRQGEVLPAVLAGELLLPLVQGGEVLHGRDDVGQREGRLLQRAVHAELLVDLVATNLRQVVALGVEVEVVQERRSGFHRGRFTGANAPVQFDERFVLGLYRVLFQRFQHRRVVCELVAQFGGGHPQRLEQDRDGLLALPVDANADGVPLVDLELEPGTPGGDDLRGEDLLVGGLVRRTLEVRARGAHELGDDDAFGSVDDEGPAVGHEREIAHEHRLRLDFTRGVVDEFCRDEKRSRVREVFVLALLRGVLRGFETVFAERQRHRLTEVFDRGNLVEDFLQPGDRGDFTFTSGFNAVTPCVVSEQPVETFDLEAEKVRSLEGLGDLREGNAAGRGPVSDSFLCSSRGARGSQEGFLPYETCVHTRALSLPPPLLPDRGYPAV